MTTTTRRIGVAAAGALLTLGLASCGWIAEEAIEQAIESESGEDIEIDFDGDDGSLSIQGENGESFSMDLEEDGERSTISGTDEDGNTFEMSSGQGAPDDWPDEVPLPSGNIMSSTAMTQNDERLFSIVLEVDDASAAHDDYQAQLEDAGFSTVSTSTFESDGNTTKFTQMSRSDWISQLSTSEDVEGNDQLIISVSTNTE